MERSNDQTMKYMMEVEEVAEDVLADRQHMVSLDRQRQDTRQAMRALQKDKDSDKAWMCFGNMFLKLPKPQAQTLLKKDFDNVDTQISEVRQALKAKVNRLRELENKEELRGFNLTALTKEEKQSLNDVL